MSIESDRYSLMFDIRRSVRYHNRRRSFFDRWGLVTNAMTIFFGSAIILAIFHENEMKWVAVTSAALVTLFSTIDLVVGTNRAGRLHFDLARRFNELERAMIQSGDYDEAALRKFIANRLEIEADEPPVLMVLDSICHNDLMRAMGYDKSEMLKISWLQRFLSQLFDYREHEIH